jgi:hypothetical protein
MVPWPEVNVALSPKPQPPMFNVADVMGASFWPVKTVVWVEDFPVGSVKVKLQLVISSLLLKTGVMVSTEPPLIVLAAGKTQPVVSVAYNSVHPAEPFNPQKLIKLTMLTSLGELSNTNCCQVGIPELSGEGGDSQLS